MSYSVEGQCWECHHREKCADKTLIEHAVYGIHALGTERGHLGAGVIKIECNNLISSDNKKEVIYHE